MAGNETRYVFDFAEGNKNQKDLLGGKGANLAEMVRLGLPVPPGFILTTEACTEYFTTGDFPLVSMRRSALTSPPVKPQWARRSVSPKTRCCLQSDPARSSPCPA